ncbi:LuxR family transcriptional regulator [Pseudonocardia dioxanivorans CB1190]|uniref:LuxR family transcriptional regulator n=1 Tax=Pseudonocardia dioxanivorans (strain ATCC 55486 / DSM 44775 / JCM 13855 / CB1190) TaxID=675635 RepID=F4CN67_PSEUX|nr:AAA family ATPase [Pseudonocardia dioxanivorans]AEA26080.1 LuxR family transcriptional regulator [Pseudonocardia dioxanivorans CB1190]
MLHGREAELRELLAAAAAAFAAGRSTSALIVGDAGIGKTRLVAEVADRLRADGVRVAWAACVADGGAPPYWPVAQLLDALGRADVMEVPASAEPEFARFLLFEAVADALRDAAPLLVVVDDLQWADAPTLRVLAALRAHLAVAPVVLLATVRDTDPGAARTLDALAADRRLGLRGLAAADLMPVLAELTGVSLDAAAAVDLHARTGGNPFFAAEVVRMRRAGRDAEVPGGVRAVLDRRLDRLPDGSETVLRAAAALDVGVTSGVDAVLLARVSDLPPAAVAETVAPAVDAGLLRVGHDRYRFPHALVADTVSARTPPQQRLDLHRRAVSALAARQAAGTASAAAVAHQMLAAARLSGDPAEARAAAAAAESAAGLAVAATAYEDAAGWLAAALAALPDDEPDARRPALLCARGEALLAAGDPPAARAAFTAAAELARGTGPPELLATAALGRTGGAAGFEVDLSDPDRVVLLEEALAALPAGDSVLRCTLTARLLVALAFTRGARRRQAVAEEAVAAAGRLGNARASAGALAAWCDAAAGPQYVAARREAATEIVETARTAGDRAVELLGRRLRLVALAEAGDWAGVDVEIDRYARVADAVRRPDLAWLVPLWRGTRATMRGDAAAEAAHAAELRRLAELSGSTNAELLGLTQGFVREGLAGRASVVVERFLELAPDLGDSAHCTIALLHALSGAPAAARQALHRWLDGRGAGMSEDERDSEWLPEAVQAARAAVLLGDRDAARALHELLSPFAGLFAIEGLLAGTWGCVAGHLGRIAALLGDDTAARRHLAVAAELDTAAGAALGERSRRWAGPAQAGTARGGPARAVPASDGRASDGRASDGTAAVESGEAVFRRAGEIWTVGWAGREVRLRDSKGMRDLAVLLARPGREVAVHELTGALGAAVATRPVELADRTAVEAYRARLRQLAAEIDDAADNNDDGRRARAVAEREALLAELGAVTRLGGRPRTAGSDVERMRKAVGNRIRQALARIDAAHPDLGRHLTVSVRTGTFCRYAPDREVRWRL